MKPPIKSDPPDQTQIKKLTQKCLKNQRNLLATTFINPDLNLFYRVKEVNKTEKFLQILNNGRFNCDLINSEPRIEFFTVDDFIIPVKGTKDDNKNIISRTNDNENIRDSNLQKCEFKYHKINLPNNNNILLKPLPNFSNPEVYFKKFIHSKGKNRTFNELLISDKQYDNNDFCNKIYSKSLFYLQISYSCPIYSYRYKKIENQVNSFIFRLRTPDSDLGVELREFGVGSRKRS